MDIPELDKSQYQAVQHKDGPLMIMASAGSGKTRVITYRIVTLIAAGVDPGSILALTFTNKAAREMRERIEQKLGAVSRHVWMGTFHSIFFRILRIHADLLGYTANFTIYDAADAKSLCQQLIKELRLDEDLYNPGKVLNRISWAKNNLISPSSYASSEEAAYKDKRGMVPEIAKIYALYEARCKAANAFDFDDLLLKFFNLITTQESVLLKYQDKFKYIMVDEYQDTNPLQYRILKTLAAGHRNLCVVGDDAQSIYSFRGATVQNILTFSVDYPEAKIYKLEQNYRSTQNIVNLSNVIINNNANRLEKTAFSQNECGEKIRIVYLENEREEAQKVADDIVQVRLQRGTSYDQVAILYRTNAQSRVVEEALRRLNVPYKIYGGLSFYSRKEIKDVLAYLRLAINFEDHEAFRRVVNYPKRGIGASTVDKILSIANTEGLSLVGVLESAENYLPPRSVNNIKFFVDLIKRIQSQAAEGDAFATLNYILKASGILELLYGDRTIEGLGKFNNLQELINAAKQFVITAQENGSGDKLIDFLQEVSLYNSTDEREGTPQSVVSLMTIHSAKGLEFSDVYVIGLESDLFPSKLSVSEDNLEEERRLFYVAATRARKRLVITNAKTRYVYGLLKESEPSIFLKELEQSAPDKLDIVTSSRTYNIRPGISRTSYKERSMSQQKPSNVASHPASFVAFSRNASQNLTEAVNFNGQELKVGSTVKHLRFGEGRVSGIDATVLDKICVMVNFVKYGAKTLVLNYAKLEILE